MYIVNYILRVFAFFPETYMHVSVYLFIFVEALLGSVVFSHLVLAKWPHHLGGKRPEQAYKSLRNLCSSFTG